MIREQMEIVVLMKGEKSRIFPKEYKILPGHVKFSCEIWNQFSTDYVFRASFLEVFGVGDV